MEQTNQEQQQQPQPKQYTYLDLLQFEPKNLWGSFGKLQDKKSAPIFSFNKAERDQLKKVFQSKEITKEFLGKNSLGPHYDVTDFFIYKKEPRCIIGTDPRNTLNTGPKYDHYLREDIDFDPMAADQLRRIRNGVSRIGLEQRFYHESKRYNVPGPNYNPKRLDLPNPPKYSFGKRQQKQDQQKIFKNSSTPNIVGPGHYLKQKLPSISQIFQKPAYTIPRAQRVGPERISYDKYQTYDVRDSIGNQVSSRNYSMPSRSFGKAQRGQKVKFWYNFTGIFKQHMAQRAVSIRIPLPKF